MKDKSKGIILLGAGIAQTFDANEMQYRMNLAIQKNIPFTNYGMAIAYMNGILERSLKLL